MLKAIEIRAHSVTGKGAAETASEAFEGASFPLAVTLKNRLPFDVTYHGFPRLAPEGPGDLDEASVCVPELSALIHLVKTAQGFAELYRLPGAALTILWEAPESLPTADSHHAEDEPAAESSNEEEAAGAPVSAEADAEEVAEETTEQVAQTVKTGKKRGRKPKNK